MNVRDRERTNKGQMQLEKKTVHEVLVPGADQFIEGKITRKRYVSKQISIGQRRGGDKNRIDRVGRIQIGGFLPHRLGFGGR